MTSSRTGKAEQICYATGFEFFFLCLLLLNLIFFVYFLFLKETLTFEVICLFYNKTKKKLYFIDDIFLKIYHENIGTIPHK